jgi:hypothetical protein
MNDDRIAGGGGFPTHPHRDMEIVTYVLDGELAHKDSMGNGSVIKSGDVQYMSAGTGVAHSEFNASDKIPVHMYQIWMFPDKQGYTPAYDQKHFSAAEKQGKLRLVVSPARSSTPETARPSRGRRRSNSLASRMRKCCSSIWCERRSGVSCRIASGDQRSDNGDQEAGTGGSDPAPFIFGNFLAAFVCGDLRPSFSTKTKN